MIVPEQEGHGFTKNRGYTLGRFGNYFLCEGQRKAMLQGYSPLPINLVRAGFEQIGAVPGAEKQDKSIESCNNPTFSRNGTNTLANTAEMPPECDRKGATTQCATGTGGAGQQTPTTGGQQKTDSRTPAGGSNPGTTAAGPTANGAAGTTGTTGPNAASGATPGARVDPDTGQPLAAGEAGGGAAGQQVAGVPVSLDGQGGWRLPHTMMLIAAALLIALIVGPPLIVRRATVGRSERVGGRR
jgi:phosphate transport system substrate-binding protein